MLDDFAMRQLPAAQADDLYELVSERQGRSLIITSNRAPSDWYPLFPNPVVAESLLDRLINTSHQVIMNGPSYRPNKRPKNPAEEPTDYFIGQPAHRIVFIGVWAAEAPGAGHQHRIADASAVTGNVCRVARCAGWTWTSTRGREWHYRSGFAG
nr:ATP-binding protein [Streptomyces cyaneus]